MLEAVPVPRWHLSEQPQAMRMDGGCDDMGTTTWQRAELVIVSCLGAFLSLCHVFTVADLHARRTSPYLRFVA